MSDHLTEERFYQVFRARIARARANAGMSQQQVATLLQVELTTYKKWETRLTSKMPHFYVERFCIATKTPCEALFTTRLDANDRAVLKPAPTRRHSA